jgi:hypothetical protein
MCQSPDEHATPIGKTGSVVEGRYKGWFTRIEPAKGGYLILWFRVDENGRVVEGYDDWVLSKDLEGFYERHDHRIDWSKSGPDPTQQRKV